MPSLLRCAFGGAVRSYMDAPGVYSWRSAVTRRIGSYQPAECSDTWWRVGTEVRRVVTKVDPSSVSWAGEALSTLTRLAVFADGQGVEASARMWLSRPFIEFFLAEGCADRAESTRAKYRSQLLRLREAFLGTD